MQLPAPKRTRSCPSLAVKSEAASSGCVPGLSSPSTQEAWHAGLEYRSGAPMCFLIPKPPFPWPSEWCLAFQPLPLTPNPSRSYLHLPHLPPLPLTSILVCSFLPSIPTILTPTQTPSLLPQPLLLHSVPSPVFHLPFNPTQASSSAASALTLLHCLSPPQHSSYTLASFSKLSDLFHMILPSPLAV